jgi:hypothetical protein
MPWTATTAYPPGLTASAKVFAPKTGAIAIRENSKSPMRGKLTGRTSETGRKPSKERTNFAGL